MKFKTVAALACAYLLSISQPCLAASEDASNVSVDAIQRQYENLHDKMDRQVEVYLQKAQDTFKEVITGESVKNKWKKKTQRKYWEQYKVFHYSLVLAMGQIGDEVLGGAYDLPFEVVEQKTTEFTQNLLEKVFQPVALFDRISDSFKNGSEVDGESFENEVTTVANNLFAQMAEEMINGPSPDVKPATTQPVAREILGKDAPIQTRCQAVVLKEDKETLCNKKLGGFGVAACLCEKSFCTKHAAPYNHNCSVNRKERQKDKLTTENPVVHHVGTLPERI